jgi:transmembrane sensor
MSDRPTPAAAGPVARSYETRAAQRAEIVLTDGTRITLAPESRIRVAADFGTERRDLYLDGEAYFDVAHDAARPFTVYTANASAHDIGTAFAVRGYTRDRTVQIVVREGVVAMSGVGPLAAGDVGLLASDGKASVRHGADVAAMLGWLEGRFSYDDAPLARVVDDLRRWHGAEIVIRDSAVATLPFTGEMNGLATRPALDLVARTLGLRVTRTGERYVLAADPSRIHRELDRTRR